MIFEFPHTAPEGYSYEQIPLKRNVVAIWIRNHHEFSYSGGQSVASIWGFYNLKTKCYHSPTNSKTLGAEVSIRDTTPYSAIIPKLTPLQTAFV